MKLKPILTFFILSAISLPAIAQGKYYWQQHVAYQMEIDMNVEQHQYQGWQKVVYTNNSADTLHQMYYHLYFNAFQPGSMMDVRSRTILDPDRRVGDRIYNLTPDQIGYQKIKSLKQNGESVEYIVDGTILEVHLNEPILPGESTEMEMEWNSQVPLQIRRSGWDNNAGVEFSMTQWYPKVTEYDENGWNPNPYIGREFYGVWGSFDVKITIDSDYLMGSTGYLQNADEIGFGYQDDGVEVDHASEETLTWHWKADHVHDFAWAADPDYVHTKKQVPGGPMLHFIHQKNPIDASEPASAQAEYASAWQKLPEYTVKAFQYMNKHFGKYPYDKFTVIQGGDGGMEYPMMTLIVGGRGLGGLVGVTVHEFIHNWYYGVLGTSENRFPWMDEGFTTYAAAEVMAHLFNPENKRPRQGNYRGYFNAHRMGFFEALDTHADHYTTNRAYSVAAYSTGAVFLNQLRYIVGSETFSRGMHRYFNQWKFKHPTGRDFLRVMEEESNMVLDWYYAYFIESAKTIDYGIQSVVDQGEETVVTLRRIDLTPMPLDVVVTYEDGTQELHYIPLRIMRDVKDRSDYPNIERVVEADWPWVNPGYLFTIDADASTIKSIEIDPSLRLADINRENNKIVLDGLTKVQAQ